MLKSNIVSHVARNSSFLLCVWGGVFFRQHGGVTRCCVASSIYRAASSAAKHSLFFICADVNRAVHNPRIAVQIFRHTRRNITVVTRVYAG